MLGYPAAMPAQFTYDSVCPGGLGAPAGIPGGPVGVPGGGVPGGVVPGGLLQQYTSQAVGDAVGQVQVQLRRQMRDMVEQEVGDHHDVTLLWLD